MMPKTYLPVLCIMVVLRLLGNGCYNRYILPRLEPTKNEVNKTIEVLTPKNQIYILEKYHITEDKIFGLDQNGKRYEELLQNVERVTIVSKLNTKQTIIVTTFVAGLTFFLYVYFALQGFSGMR